MGGHGRDLPTPLWDPEVNRTIQETLPTIVVDAFALLTRLGDGATLVAVAVLLYWFGAEANRDQRAMVLAIAVATLALVAGLKGILQVQRPLYAADPPLALAPDSYGGWATPSAHSMGAAAVYGALAVVMDVGERWQRYAVAGFLILAIPLSRVVIGVHYVGDVLLGAALGLLLVFVAIRLSTRSVTTMFALSLVIALAAFVLGSEEYTEMAIGASIGGLVAWSVLRDHPSNPTGASLLLLGIVVIPAFFVVQLLDLLIAVEGGIIVSGVGSITFVTIGQTIGYAIAFGAAIAVPHVATMLNDTVWVRRLQTALPFRGRTVNRDAIGEEPTAEELRAD